MMLLAEKKLKLNDLSEQIHSDGISQKTVVIHFCTECTNQEMLQKGMRREKEINQKFKQHLDDS
jgi:hypothetical protein